MTAMPEHAPAPLRPWAPALAELERKILTLKARPASAPAIADDDLFAPKAGNGGGDGADAALPARGGQSGFAGGERYSSVGGGRGWRESL